MLSEFSDFFRTPYVDQHAKEVPKNIVFGGAPFRCPAKAFKDTVFINACSWVISVAITFLGVG